ncbi:hypothetical protein QYE76_065306 [Lolium multiflorum]|uniref:Uncharacterized protein n=1 Tax=Lolium multiflorum TaxID=4521 RepID=A0AAD8S9W2_LOLMU|nr:hypothetical protein QYE76_065306 [Lolium multiflorum]
MSIKHFSVWRCLLSPTQLKRVHAILAPFTSTWQSNALHLLVIEKSEIQGSYVYDIHGNNYLTYLAGLCCTALGVLFEVYFHSSFVNYLQCLQELNILELERSTRSSESRILITTCLKILPQQIGVAVHLSLPVPNNDKKAVQGLALPVSKGRADAG